ncbi:MAG: aminopeptidase [candidate division Zixibacteria bacterium]|nr:aminopeptidase [candidate division Zixibacteria bacterium]
MDKLLKAAQVAVNNCLAVKKGESVLVITDEPERKIGYAFWEAAEEAGSEAMLLEILPRSSNGEEPPEAVAKFMKDFDVLIIPTSKSMTHTNARREACEAGARCVTLPGILEDTMERTLNADYHEIAKRSIKLAEIVSQGRTAKVTTPAGTDITMSLEGRECHADTGLVHNPGDFSNLPAGEAYIAPVEGTANGIIMVDGAMMGKVKTPIKIVVKDGFATQITGDRSAEELEKVLEPFGQPGRNIAELGIGTNHKAQIVGSVLEDEKVMGTVHMALGDNKSMGGNVSVQSHLDGILLKPTLWIDDKKIMEDGVLKI